VTDITASAETPPAPPAPESGAPESDGAPRSARELVLDHLGDTAEADPQSVDAIMAGTGLTSRDAVHQALHRLVEAGDAIRVETGLYRIAPPKPKQPPAAAAPPPLAVAEADVELFTALLTATSGHVVVGQPRGTGITDLRMIHSMLLSGADLEADILPTIRGHVGELAQRPLDSWTAPWFVQGVAESHRRRLEAANPIAPAAPAKASVPPIDDAELLEKLLDAGHGNFVAGPGIHDLAPIRVMLADGIALDDILSTLRDKVSRRILPANSALRAWGEPRFLRHVAVTHLRRTTVPGMIAAWSKACGEPAARVEPPATISAP
jgi:hypothetical protein